MYASWASSISISYILHRVMNHWLFWKKLGAGGKIFSRNKEIKYLGNFKYNLPSPSLWQIYIRLQWILIDFQRAKVFHCFRNMTQVQGRKKFLKRFPDIEKRSSTWYSLIFESHKLLIFNYKRNYTQSIDAATADIEVTKRRGIYIKRRMRLNRRRQQWILFFFFFFDKTIDDETGIKASIVVTTGRQQ